MLCSYLEVVQVVSCIQVYAFGFLIYRHDGQTDIQRSMEFPSLNLQHHKDPFTSVMTAVGLLNTAHTPRENVKIMVVLLHLVVSLNT